MASSAVADVAGRLPWEWSEKNCDAAAGLVDGSAPPLSSSLLSSLSDSLSFALTFCCSLGPSLGSIRGLEVAATFKAKALAKASSGASSDGFGRRAKRAWPSLTGRPRRALSWATAGAFLFFSRVAAADQSSASSSSSRLVPSSSKARISGGSRAVIPTTHLARFRWRPLVTFAITGAQISSAGCGGWEASAPFVSSSDEP
mmetsp:Transcript_54042/g.123162  ORF Transcript_54042/g.123162 Transcript_54042/m.123162 type:complete len:201 (-) Transcript_54042:55-657(-)